MSIALKFPSWFSVTFEFTIRLNVSNKHFQIITIFLWLITIFYLAGLVLLQYMPVINIFLTHHILHPFTLHQLLLSIRPNKEWSAFQENRKDIFTVAGATPLLK